MNLGCALHCTRLCEGIIENVTTNKTKQTIQTTLDLCFFAKSRAFVVPKKKLCQDFLTFQPQSCSSTKAHSIMGGRLPTCTGNGHGITLATSTNVQAESCPQHIPRLYWNLKHQQFDLFLRFGLLSGNHGSFSSKEKLQ